MLVAPSTAQDAEHRLLRASLRGLADAPVRVLATWNRRLPSEPLPVPANARVVDWVVYSRAMPRCAVVVCHAGHGTLVRALSCGCAVVACPAVGDMNENAARLDWAGAGVRVPRRFVSPRTVRLAVERALEEPSIRARARELADWAAAHDAERSRLRTGRAVRRRPRVRGHTDRMDDAVGRYCAAVEAGDMAALEATLAPDVALPSPVIGRAVFRGREDVTALLTAVYRMLQDVHWERPVGEGPTRLAIAEARVGPMRIDDAMVFELDGEGRILRIRPHLRPLLAMMLFFVMIGPRMLPRPGVVLRAVRR